MHGSGKAMGEGYATTTMLRKSALNGFLGDYSAFVDDYSVWQHSASLTPTVSIIRASNDCLFRLRLLGGRDDRLIW